MDDVAGEGLGGLRQGVETPTPGSVSLIKRFLKEEMLKPRYHEAFGPVVNKVLIEHGLAAQLCTDLYDIEVHGTLPSDRASINRLTTTRWTVSSLPSPSSKCAILDELSFVTSLMDQWTLQLHRTLTVHCEESGMPLMFVGDPTRLIGRSCTRGLKFLYTVDDMVALLEGCTAPQQCWRPWRRAFLVPNATRAVDAPSASVARDVR